MFKDDIKMPVQLLNGNDFSGISQKAYPRSRRDREVAA